MQSRDIAGQRQLPIYPPTGADATRAERGRDVLYAVAEGRAAWRAAFGAKPLAAALNIGLTSTYRKLDSAEAFLRWLIATFPAESLRMLSALSVEAAALLADGTDQARPGR